MFDRRIEVKRALEQLAALDLDCTESRYELVKRFTHSFAILNRQLERKPQFWNRLPIDRLYKKLSQIEQVSAEPIPWLSKETFRNRFWVQTIALAKESLSDIESFLSPVAPSFEYLEPSFEWYGIERPDLEFYSNGVTPSFEASGDLVDYTPTGHFSNWFALRLAALEILEWYGLVLPEDVDLDDRWSFFLIEDQQDTQKAVYVEMEDVAPLSGLLFTHIRSLLCDDKSDWAIVFCIGELGSIYLYRHECYTVGDHLRQCKTLQDISQMQVE